MKWMRRFAPRWHVTAAIVTACVAGNTLAAQNQDEPEPNPPKVRAASPQSPKSDATNGDAKPAEELGQSPEIPKRSVDSNQPAEDQAIPQAPRVGNETERNQRQPGEQQRPMGLGARFVAQGNQGITATNIERSGILSQAGLKQNDRIISADGRTFTNPRQFEAYLWSQAGRSVPIIVERGNQRYTIQANFPMHSNESGWLGVFLDEGDANTKGARVTQVYPSGPAARAGIQVGDIIQQINKQPVLGSHDVVMMIRDFQPQSKVDLTVARDDQQVNIPVVVGTRGNFNYQSFYAGSQQPRQQGQFPGQSQGQENDQFNDVPLHAMQLEHDRRNAEQHERIEEEIRLLREEVQKLRELLEKK